MPPQQQDGELLQAYGHPTTAFFHLFWKAAAILVYIFCGIFSSSFIVNFVVIVLLLTLDFWTTKNVSGRLLVGLRWWNETTDEGSNWRFETLEEGQRSINKKDSACFWWSLYIMPVAWLALGIIALVKVSVGKGQSTDGTALLTALFRKNWIIANPKNTLAAFGKMPGSEDYLLVIAVALVLNSANVVGYTKCSKQASSQLRDMARNAMTSGLTAAISRV